MYLLYLDETENAGADLKSNALKIFGLSGILLTPRYATAIVTDFWNLKKRYTIPDNWEIHGCEIFSGSGKWKKISDENRRQFCKDLSGLIAKNNKVARAWFIYKESKLLKEDYMISLSFLIDESCNFVGKYGNNTGRQVMVIFDQKDEFQRIINELILRKRNWINGSNVKNKCRIIDHGFPGNSEYSELLQLSDFVGYVFRLSKTIRRKDSLFSKAHDPRFIAFVDELVDIMKTKVRQREL